MGGRGAGLRLTPRGDLEITPEGVRYRPLCDLNSVLIAFGEAIAVGSVGARSGVKKEIFRNIFWGGAGRRRRILGILQSVPYIRRSIHLNRGRVASEHGAVKKGGVCGLRGASPDRLAVSSRFSRGDFGQNERSQRASGKGSGPTCTKNSVGTWSDDSVPCSVRISSSSSLPECLTRTLGTPPSRTTR